MTCSMLGATRSLMDVLMAKQDLLALSKGRRVVPPIDFKELERIHKEWERHDLDGRYKVTPSDPKGPKL